VIIAESESEGVKFLFDFKNWYDPYVIIAESESEGVQFQGVRR
jgi:hypothetical protein